MNKSKKELFNTIIVIFFNFYKNTLNNSFLSKYAYKISIYIYFAKLWWLKIKCATEEIKCLIFNHFINNKKLEICLIYSITKILKYFILIIPFYLNFENFLSTQLDLSF